MHSDGSSVMLTKRSVVHDQRRSQEFATEWTKEGARGFVPSGVHGAEQSPDGVYGLRHMIITTIAIIVKYSQRSSQILYSLQCDYS